MGLTTLTAFEAEGARVAIAVCDECGAALFLHPRDRTDRPKQHEEWHARQRGSVRTAVQDFLRGRRG